MKIKTKVSANQGRPKKIYRKRKSIYIDVDETLVRSGMPNRTLISKINEWYDQGYYLVLWSAAGEKHARNIADRLGISDKFKAILTKPETIIDDMGREWSKYIAIHKP